MKEQAGFHRTVIHWQLDSSVKALQIYVFSFWKKAESR